VLSGKVLCDGPMPRPEESYECVMFEYDLGTSKNEAI